MSDIEIKVDASDLKKMQAGISEMQDRATMAAAVGSRKLAEQLQKKVKQHASGRPGPNVISGAYRGSISISSSEGGGSSATTYVSTSAAQAHRLEFGFVGTDSLGRHYSQPALPHWRPAMTEMQPAAEAVLREMWQMIRGG